MRIQGFYSRSALGKITGLFCLLLVAFTLSACDLARNFQKPDREANLEIQDYRDALAPRTDQFDKPSASADSVPALQPYVAAPSQSLKSMPLVSISVDQSVPLRDVLFELAKQADYDLELDPRIRGAVIFTVRDRPLDQVVERISDIAGLRYRFEDSILRVELDTPYSKLYKVDYLNYIRENQSTISSDISVVSGEGADTGSSFEASGKTDSNFWAELEANLGQILTASSQNLRTNVDPSISALPQAGGANVAGQGAVLNVQSLPVNNFASPVAAVAGAAAGLGSSARFSINKQAGLINVYASEKLHKDVKRYLDLVKRAVTAQVLIEAKILEVSLFDEYHTGIDWRLLDTPGGEWALNYTTTAGNSLLDTISNGAGGTIAPTTSAAVNATSSNFVFGYGGNDVQSLIQAVSGFGTVRALASPRMTVLNNQAAVLNVSSNRVFFELDIDVSVDDNGDRETDIDSDIRNVPEGVLVNVQPSIDLDTGLISLAVRPTVTRVINTVADPAVQFVTASHGITGVESAIPELNVQEIDSVLQVRSGRPVVMGGLLQDRISSTEEGVPVLSEVPMFGSFFRKHGDSLQKTELVILLKATILDTPSSSIHETDRDIYKTFSSDRRPFDL